MKGWRTYCFNVISGVFVYLEMTGTTGLVPPEWQPMAGLLIAVGNIALRSITTTAPGKAT